MKEILDRHSNLFKEELSKITGTTAKLYLKSDAQPKFCRARPVPFAARTIDIAVRTKVEQEINHQVVEGILEPVQFSEWATPVVPVIKKDGSVRLCGDYKVSYRKLSSQDRLPRIEDMFASLSGGTVFSKLDLAHAYQQVLLDDSSKELVAINTHKGLYRVNRLHAIRSGVGTFNVSAHHGEHFAAFE